MDSGTVHGEKWSDKYSGVVWSVDPDKIYDNRVSRPLKERLFSWLAALAGSPAADSVILPQNEDNGTNRLSGVLLRRGGEVNSVPGQTLFYTGAHEFGIEQNNRLFLSGFYVEQPDSPESKKFQKWFLRFDPRYGLSLGLPSGDFGPTTVIHFDQDGSCRSISINMGDEYTGVYERGFAHFGEQNECNFKDRLFVDCKTGQIFYFLNGSNNALPLLPNTLTRLIHPGLRYNSPPVGTIDYDANRERIKQYLDYRQTLKAMYPDIAAHLESFSFKMYDNYLLVGLDLKRAATELKSVQITTYKTSETGSYGLQTIPERPHQELIYQLPSRLEVNIGQVLFEQFTHKDSEPLSRCILSLGKAVNKFLSESTRNPQPPSASV